MEKKETGCTRNQKRAISFTPENFEAPDHYTREGFEDNKSATLNHILKNTLKNGRARDENLAALEEDARVHYDGNK